MVGYYKTLVLYALGIDLLVVAFGFTMLKPFWNMQYFFPRFVLLLSLLFLPSEWDKWCLDVWMK